jgi:cobalt-precorrin 5A hydrolase
VSASADDRRVEPRVSAGLGCRSECSAQDIIAALDAVLARAGRARAEVRALYAPDTKSSERGLLAAAESLRIPLLFLTLPALRLHRSAALTSSPRVQALYRVPSIAETAALAGAAAAELCGSPQLGGASLAAAQRVRLLGPRHAVGGATCALAVVERGS